MPWLCMSITLIALIREAALAEQVCEEKSDLHVKLFFAIPKNSPLCFLIYLDFSGILSVHFI